jgi:hypothetical protein
LLRAEHFSASASQLEVPSDAPRCFLAPSPFGAGIVERITSRHLPVQPT